MEGDWDDLFSVDEIMGGLPARRASALLFAIEGRTAQLVARSRRALARDYTGRTAEQEEQAFLTALAEGASMPVEPTVQDLERYAADWASLVPDDPSIRAALARSLGAKYRLPAARTRRLLQALGTDDPETAERFQELYGAPVSSIFAVDLTWRERVRWVRSRVAARLETLPPFWTAFALTLTETVGASILALPIAFAELGVLGALIIMLVLGVVNVLTIAAMAEAVARNGDIRYGHAYFGRLVQSYLGRPGVAILTPALLVFSVVILITYAIGIASTLSDSLGLSPTIWVLALLAVVLVILRKDSLGATVASALLIGACSIGLLVILSLLAVAHLQSANIRHSEIPFVGGNGFDAGVVELIFGVGLIALFGHTSTANCAAVVLERDPSARSLIRGCTTALITATVLNMLWIAAVNGAIGPGRLAVEPGTALTPLAEVAGPAVSVLGTLFVVLAMGMASVQYSWGLSNATKEWLRPVTATDRPTRLGVSSQTVRQLAGRAPTVAIMLGVALLFALDRESFTGALGFLGVITAPLIAGIFAMMMLAAARRKGDCAVGYQWRFLGSRFVVAGVCTMSLAAILIHGLFIWTDPLRRAVALVVAAITVVYMIAAVRTSFVRRVVAEIRYSADDHEPMPTIAVVASGDSLPGSTVQELEAGLGGDHTAGSMIGRMRSAVEICIPPTPVRELMVWVHELLPDGGSIPLSATLEINGVHSFQLDGKVGKIVLPVNGEAQHLIVKPALSASGIGMI